MQNISDLDLYHLAMEQPWFAEHPQPHFAEARMQHPWLAKSDLGYVVTSYQAVRDLMAHKDRMRWPFDHLVDLMDASGTPWGTFQERHLMGRTGEEHARLRNVLAPSFTPRRANEHRSLMREVISGLLDEWEPKGAFDFEEFASHFPITVMCKLMGISPDIIPALRSSLEAMGLGISMNPDLLSDLNEAFETLDAAAQQVIDEREASWKPGDEADLLDLLMDAKAKGGMSRRELADLIIFLLVGGFDTSKNMLTLVMYELVDRPDDHARCAEDLDFCAKVVDETMRIHGASNTNRLVTQDIDYRGVHIPAGTVLWFPWGVIGCDPASAEEPDRFDPHKDRKNPHVGFGLGPHICLGKFIARALLSEGVHLIAQRIAQPSSPGPRGWRPFLGVWGIRGLPIEFEPAPGRDPIESSLPR